MSYFQEVHIADAQMGKKAWVTPMHSLLTAETTRLVGPMFGSVIDSNFYTANHAGVNAASGVADGKATLVSGETSNAYGVISSNRKARFMFANPNLYRSVIRILRGATQNDQGTFWFGAIDVAPIIASGYPPHGFYFMVDATTLALRIGCSTSNSDVYLDSGSFNGDVTSYVFDFAFHACEIIYLVDSAHFFIDGVFIGKITPDTYTFGDIDLPCGAGVTTTGVVFAIGASPSMEVYANSILRLGKEHSVPTWRYITNAAATGILKRGSGELHKIINNDNVGSIILYDAVSAVATATICSIDLTKVLGALDLDLSLQTGLYYALTGAGKITVVYE